MPRRAKICQSILQVLADLEHARVFQHRLERRERRPFPQSGPGEASPPARTGRCRPWCRRRGGRAARSRLRCRRRRARMPQSCAVIGSGPVVLVSSATTPMSLARSIQAFSRSSVRTVSYLLRSNLPALAAARCAAASAAGDRSLRCLGLGCAAAAAARTDRRSCRRGSRRLRARREPVQRARRAACARRELGVRPRSRSPRCRTSRRRAASAWRTPSP